VPELDLRHLEKRLTPAGVSGLRALAGGASSLTYAGQLADHRVVIKVAPPGVAPILNRDVLRQARLIRALETTPVPVPQVLWEDPGEPPGIPPLFVMSFLEGSSLEPLFDGDADGPDEEVVASRMRNAAQAMAELHRVDPQSLALGPESVVGPAQEIDRWGRLLETIDPALVPGWPEVSVDLRTSLPAADGPAVVHGDFRLGNLLAVDAEITAVIDWEIWSLGDHRVDVGWFLLNADPRTYRRRTRYAGSTPRPDDLSAVYAETLGKNVPDLAWFQALAAFKSAATWSLIVKHNRRRKSPDPVLEAMAPVLPELLDRARQLLAG
jgi:aminoglycoside phosphotransferase (APT) family kinase protein